MSFTQMMEELPRLTADERRLLVERACALDGTLFSSEEDAIIEARLAAQDRDPSSAVPADEILARLHTRFAK